MKKQDGRDHEANPFPKTGKPVLPELIPLIEFLAEQAAREVYELEEKWAGKMPKGHDVT